MKLTRSHEEYEQAREIIKIMISEGVIPKEVDIGDYFLDCWNAAFAILDLLSAPKGK